MSKIKLSVDFDSLFPGKVFKIKDQEITIYPLNIQQISYVIKKVNTLIPEFEKKNIYFDNLGTPENMFNMVSIIMDNAPEILSELTGIEEESIKKLPVSYAIELFSTALEVNIESKDDLQKNFNGLSKKMMNLIPTEEKKKK